MRLLVATGDDELREVLHYWLQGHGFEVTVAPDGERALHLAQQEHLDLALLDAALPGVDGIAVCRQLAVGRPAPLMMVLTRPGHDLEDELAALDARAAACSAVLFSPALLLARLRAVVRRAKLTAATAPGPRPISDSLLKVGPLALDMTRHEVVGARGRVRLTPIESRLLHLLMMNAGQVLPTALLVERVWGYDGTETEGGTLVKTHMRHLRQKVEWEPSTPCHLVTVPGCGYSFLVHPAARDSSATPEPTLQRLA